MEKNTKVGRWSIIEKVVIFDWGGVVESHENNMEEIKAAQIRIIKRFNNNLSDEEILERWTKKTSTGILIGVTNNGQDIKNWVYELQKNMNINVEFDEFKKAYEEEMALVSYYKEVVQYAHSLKNKCRIAILSNLGPFDKKRINAQYDLSKFDDVFLSFEIGMRKPDKRVYEYVLERLKVTPENILFIDDDIDNILMAQQYCWNTCQAYGYELDKIKCEVEKFLSR